MRQLTEGAVCLGLLSRKFGGALSRQAVAAVYSGHITKVIETLFKYKEDAETLATVEVAALPGDGPVDVRFNGTAARSL